MYKNEINCKNEWQRGKLQSCIFLIIIIKKDEFTSAHACCIYLKLMPVISIIYAI